MSEQYRKIYPCSICGKEAHVTSGRFVVCSGRCDDVASEYTKYETRIKELEEYCDYLEKDRLDKRDRIDELVEGYAKHWIPTTACLPKNKAVVMIASNKSDYITIAMWVAGLWFGDDGNPEPWTDVTHWMPLPEPPPQDQEK